MVKHYLLMCVSEADHVALHGLELGNKLLSILEKWMEKKSETNLFACSGWYLAVLFTKSTRRVDWIELSHNDSFENVHQKLFCDTTADKCEGALCEQLHQLADLLPSLGSYLLDICWIMMDSYNPMENPEMASVFWRLLSFHGAYFNIISDSPNASNVDEWGKLLRASQYYLKDFVPGHLFHSHKCWRGFLLVYNDDMQQHQLLSGFSLDYLEDEAFVFPAEPDGCSFGPALELVATLPVCNIPLKLLTPEMYYLVHQDDTCLTSLFDDSSELAYLLRLPILSIDQRNVPFLKQEDWSILVKQRQFQLTYHDLSKRFQLQEGQSYVYFLLLPLTTDNNKSHLLRVHNSMHSWVIENAQPGYLSLSSQQCVMTQRYQIVVLSRLVRLLYLSWLVQSCDNYNSFNSSKNECSGLSRVLQEGSSDSLSSYLQCLLDGFTEGNDSPLVMNLSSIVGINTIATFKYLCLLREQKVKHCSTSPLKGIPAPTPAKLFNFNPKEVLNLFKKNGEARSKMLGLPKKSGILDSFVDTVISSEWPTILNLEYYDIYFNSSSQEEKEDCGRKLKDRIIQKETQSSCVENFSSMLHGRPTFSTSSKTFTAPSAIQKCNGSKVVSIRDENLRKSPRLKSLQLPRRSPRKKSFETRDGASLLPSKNLKMLLSLLHVKTIDELNEYLKKKLRNGVTLALEGENVGMENDLFPSCAKKLFSICRTFLMDLLSQKNIGKHTISSRNILGVAKAHVKQVVKFEKNKRT